MIPFSCRLATPEDVRQFFSWRYEPPYDIYQLDETTFESELAYYLDPCHQFHALVDHAGALVALCSFGADGQVPGGDYGADALDIGMGVRPDLTGQGRGAVYVQQVVDFALASFAPNALRVTIAAFNLRAQKVWQKVGFVESSRFGRTKDGVLFVIYLRAC